MVPEAAPAAAGDLLTPANHMLAMVDLQSQMDFATTSIDPVRLRNNAAMVAMTGVSFEVSVITDACGDAWDEAHERAVTCMIQAGMRLMTALQYLLELQRDWSRAKTARSTVDIARRYGTAYGIGIAHADAMLLDDDA